MCARVCVSTYVRVCACLCECVCVCACVHAVNLFFIRRKAYRASKVHVLNCVHKVRRQLNLAVQILVYDN